MPLVLIAVKEINFWWPEVSTEKFFGSAQMADSKAVELTSNSVLDEGEDDLTVYDKESQKPR